MSDQPVLKRQSYGKSQVRVSRIERRGERHEFIELTVWAELAGDFDASYTAADNSKIVATDTVKNTVYVLAKRHGIGSAEAFCQRLAKHFLDTYAHVESVDVRAVETPWARMQQGGKQHPHAFLGGSSERNTCDLVATRSATTMHSGLLGLQVLKTTESGFTDFLQDEYTTLPPTEDRIFATSIEARWPCRELGADWTEARQVIRQAFIEAFAVGYSKSVQHTLYEMARGAFAKCPLIDEISITMPNQHHLLANLSPFGLQNANEVFVPTSEPFGRISATIARSGGEKRS